MSAAKAKQLHEDNRIDNWAYLWMAAFTAVGYVFFSLVNYLFGIVVMKWFGAALVLILTASYIYSMWKKTNSERRTVYVLMFVSIILRLCYLIATAKDSYPGDSYEIFTEVHTNLTLPETYQPLYYVAAAFVYNLVGLFRYTQPIATELVRLVTEYLGVVSAIVMYYILCELEVNNTGVYLCTALIAFNPGLIVIGGEISPVMTTFTLLMFTMLFLSRWNNFTDGYNFVFMSVAFGMAVMTDLSALVFAPVILVLVLINLIRAFKRRSVLNIISTSLQTLLGLVIWAVLSFAYPVRNMMLGQATGLSDLVNEVSRGSSGFDYHTKFLSFSMSELMEVFVNPEVDQRAWIYLVKSSIFGNVTNLPVEVDFMLLRILVAVGFVTMAIAAVMIVTNVFTKIDAKKKVNIWAFVALTLSVAGYYVLVNVGRPEPQSMEFRIIPIVLGLLMTMLGTGVKTLSMKKKLSFVSQLLYLFVVAVCVAYCAGTVVYGCLCV